MSATDEGREPGSNERAAVGAVERELRAPAAAGIAGLLFVTLSVVSLALLYREPPHRR